MTARVPVTFEPSGATVLAEPGTTVATAARRAGVTLSTPCGTRGICGDCGVRVVFGSLEPPDETEAATLRKAPAGVRLACRARVNGPVGVRPLVVSGATRARAYALGSDARLVAGVDLGTTNVSARLVECASGAVVAEATVENRQRVHGADVLSRLAFATEGGGDELADLAEASVVEALSAVAEAASTDASRIDSVVIAGNTAMSSLLLRMVVASLTAHPFEPPYRSTARLKPRGSAGTAVPALVDALVLPPIAAFVGGDALAAALATGLLPQAQRGEQVGQLQQDGVRLLVDVGTNAEIVLRASGGLTVASAAAGPAFEGWGVSSGGRAGFGAVDRAVIGDSGAVRLETPGGESPERFSGAGLVSALAVLRSMEWLDADGRVNEDVVPPERLTVAENGVRSVRLGSGERVLGLSQLDIRSLQLAKGAIRAGIDCTLYAAGVDVAEVRELLLAGAFGHALDVEAAATVGLVPRRVGGCAHARWATLR